MYSSTWVLAFESDAAYSSVSPLRLGGVSAKELLRT